MEYNPLKILAIDDNQDNLTSVKALIKDAFPQALILTATEAGKGIELAQAESPDVILLDVVMPRIDGFEACRQLKANPLTRFIPVVFLTALKGDKEARIRALEAGAESFLSKPIDEVELIAQIRAMRKINAASTRERAEKEALHELVAARTRELDLAHMAALNLLEDLRRENEARRESEAHLRLLFENLPSGVVVHAADTAVRFANSEALRLLGLTLEQMQGKCATDPIWCFLREDGGSLALEDYPVNRLRTSGKPFAGQIIGIRLPGQAESNWVQCSAYPQLDASGQLSQVIVAFTDITARMHAEEALKESEARFRGYVEHAPYGVFVTDAQGRYVDVNPAAERISGYSATRLTSMSIPDLLTAESRETGQSEFQTLVATGRLATELGYRHADGSLRYWSVSATRLGPDRYMGYVEDITERREREAHMALLVRMLDEAPAAITIHDTSGRFLFSNRQNILLHGCASEEEFMSVNLHDLDTPESKALQAERFQQITEQGAARFEVTHRRRNGSTFPLDVTARAIEWRGQQAVLSIALDITERKQAEAKIEQESLLSNTIIDSIPGTFYLLDEEGCYARWNTYQREVIVGKPDDQIAGFPAIDTIHPEDREHIQARIAKVLQDGKEDTVVGRVLLHGGPASIWMLMTGRRMMIEGKSFLVGTGIDITERKQAEAALLRSDALQRKMISNIGDVIVIIDNNGINRYKSENIERFFGWKPEEVIGERALANVHPDDVDAAQAFMIALLKTPNATATIQVRYRCKNGSYKWISFTGCNLLHDPDIHGILGNYKDITEHKLADDYRTMSVDIMQILNEPGDLSDAIQRIIATCKTRIGLDAVGLRLQEGEDFPYYAQDGFSKEFLLKENTLLERGEEGGLCRDKDDRVSLECTCGLVISGKTEAAGQLCTRGGSFWTNDSCQLIDLPGNQDPRLHPRKTCIHHGYASMALVPIRTKDTIVGLLHLCERRKGRLTLETVELLEGIASHIGEALMRKQAEEERAQMQAQLIQSQKLESIGTLASGVAHEINNPIMGIMGYAQLLFDHLGPDSPVSEYALEIGKETERIALIAKNLLGFARQENETHLSPARLCDIIASTLSLITSVMRHDQIALEVNVPADLPRITCRSQQIQQVVMNLLTNARDAVNQKYPKPDANKIIRLSAALGRRNAKGVDCVRLTVEDHGVGISEDLRTRIFDPFFTTKPRDKGTGLGLSISYGIVTEHGGELSIESEFGHWTRVHMDLPLNVEAELGLEKEEHE
jgi:PAS domain S-box-containing protein